MKFTYNSGQQPLEGYTIKRGIGRGGFGEVYYALSDGGKEVALKLICANLDVELRGMSQCLNLKHPNLVNIFDMRTDSVGNHWVIMEYVTGESLSAILNRHPKGLSEELAREWFAGFASAVGYLHEHGIVHRDLKPGNIFIENGTVKVGDYGLCKFIGGSQRSAQTQSVGTVHYMAPEISTGNYNRQIDIYASGIILYEMLTGHVPFDGESAGEILMKHLTAPPDLHAVPSNFVPIVDKALFKNPAHRYRTVSEMAKDVALAGTPIYVEPGPRTVPMGKPAVRVLKPAEPAPVPAVQVSWQKRTAELSSSLIFAAVLAALFTVMWAGISRTSDLPTLSSYFFLTVGCCWAVLVPTGLWNAKVSDSWTRRAVLMALGAAIGFEALWLDGHELPNFTSTAWAAEAPPVVGDEPVRIIDRLLPDNRVLPTPVGYLAYFGLVFFAMRWWKMAERRRTQRFNMSSVFVAAFWAFIFLFLLPGPREQQISFIVVILTAVIIQLASPWQEPTPMRTRRMRLRYA